jgi:hypothetical protein
MPSSRLSGIHLYRGTSPYEGTDYIIIIEAYHIHVETSTKNNRYQPGIKAIIHKRWDLDPNP